MSFPVVSRTDKDFVDVKFFNASQHALARAPGSQLRFEGGYEPFKPFVHGAFVDPTQWLILQFTHPRILLHPNETLTEAQKADLRHFAKTALIALARHRHLGALATPTALWSLPEGFPHNTELAQTNNFTRAPEYVLLLKRRPNTERLQPPSHVKLDHIAASKAGSSSGGMAGSQTCATTARALRMAILTRAVGTRRGGRMALIVRSSIGRLCTEDCVCKQATFEKVMSLKR